jgi:hypothetical protein
MSTKQKIIIGFLAMIVWLALAWAGKTPVQSFVDMLRDILVTIGAVHVALTNPKE